MSCAGPKDAPMGFAQSGQFRTRWAAERSAERIKMRHSAVAHRAVPGDFAADPDYRKLACVLNSKPQFPSPHIHPCRTNAFLSPAAPDFWGHIFASGSWPKGMM